MQAKTLRFASKVSEMNRYLKVSCRAMLSNLCKEPNSRFEPSYSTLMRYQCIFSTNALHPIQTEKDAVAANTTLHLLYPGKE